MPTGYLIQNGQVYDGSGSSPAAVDIRVGGHEITEIGAHLPVQGERAIDASGLLVTPGLVDLHTHVYSGMGDFAVDPEAAGLRTGVTTLLDTGTAGALTYPTFHRFVMPVAQEDIFALLHISRFGVLQNHFLPPYTGELADERQAHVPSAVACIEKYRDRIVGVKVRLTAGLAGQRVENERAGLLGALEAASKTGLPYMVHHVLSSIPLDEVLDAMRSGDILTHLYHPQPDNAFSQPGGAPADALLRARDRGVLCDVGHGSGAFAWAIAEPACQEHGFWPDTISTDIHQFNLRGPVYDLPTTMAKFLYLGMPLAQVIRAVTYAPAQAMHLADRFGLLRTGRQADITLLRIEAGRWELVDVNNQVRVANQRLSAAATFKRGMFYGSMKDEV
jgi:dihydroorotase